MTETLSHHNPIPQALAHYEAEYLSVLASLGVESHRASWSKAVEGRAGLLSTASLAANGVWNTARATLSTFSTVHLWPTWGILDARLLSYARSPQAVVLHDPYPIRAQVGHGGWAQWWAARANKDRSSLVVVHSKLAEADAAKRLPDHTIVRLEHPILSKQTLIPKTEQPTLVVAGQYKPERDIEQMKAIADLLRGSDWKLTVHGRGWPIISGWAVDSRFLSEQELDTVLGAAHAVLIPYKNYYQSGIAIRALELGTASIGFGSPYLTELSAEQPELAPTSLGQGTLKAALGLASHRDTASHLFASHLEKAHASWSRLVALLNRPRVTLPGPFGRRRTR